MKDTYEIESLAVYKNKEGKQVYCHHFLINNCYMAYTEVDNMGRYTDGTFKEDTEPTKQMLAVINK